MFGQTRDLTPFERVTTGTVTVHVLDFVELMSWRIDRKADAMLFFIDAAGVSAVALVEVEVELDLVELT